MSNRTLCYCVDEVPPASDKVDASKCNLSCPGYPDDNCKSHTPSLWSQEEAKCTDNATGGGVKFFQFYDNGVALSIPTASPASSSTNTVASSTSTSPPSSTKAPVQSATSSASGKPSSTGVPSSKPNTAGIAAGVVIGVVVIAGALGGLWFFMKQRKKRALEEEHRRNAEANAFNKPSHNPFNDTRLDPAVLAQRRMSDGSIADNQDYSRRILKVCLFSPTGPAVLTSCQVTNAWGLLINEWSSLLDS